MSYKRGPRLFNFLLGGGLVATFSVTLNRVHLIPATSAMSPKFNSKRIQIPYLRCDTEEVRATSALAPYIGIAKSNQ